MSQATTWSVPLSGPVAPDVMAQRMDESFDALLSSHSGTSRPAYAVAGTEWVSTATAGLMKFYVFDGASDRLIKTIDTATGAVIYSDGTVDDIIGKRARRGHLFGLTLANDTAGDATNDIIIAVGEAASEDTSPFLMVLASALTKRTDAAWAAGNNQGIWLDGASMPNGTGFIYAMQRSDTGVVDIGASASLTPTLPTNYDRKRRIGAIIRASGAILPFIQHDDEFWHNNPTNGGIQDVNAASTGTSAVTRTLTVPIGIQVDAIINLGVSNTSSAASVTTASPLEIADVAVGATVAHGLWNATSGSGAAIVVPGKVRTNASGQIRTRANVSGASITLQIATLGWIDKRGRLA